MELGTDGSRNLLKASLRFGAALNLVLAALAAALAVWAFLSSMFVWAGLCAVWTVSHLLLYWAKRRRSRLGHSQTADDAYERG